MLGQAYSKPPVANEPTALQEYLNNITQEDINSAEESASNFVLTFPKKFEDSEAQLQIPHESLIGLGEHQAVIRIPVRGYWAMKVSGIRESEGSLVARGKPIGRYPNQLWETIDCLKSASINALIPPSCESCVEIGTYIGPLRKERKQFFYFTITPDISMDGALKVCQAQEIDYTTLKNGSILKTKFESDVEAILQLVNDERYGLRFNSHRNSGNDSRSAIERMFFVVVDPATNLGELVCGDLDHVHIVNIERDGLFKDSIFKYHETREITDPLKVISQRVLSSRW